MKSMTIWLLLHGWSERSWCSWEEKFTSQNIPWLVPWCAILAKRSRIEQPWKSYCCLLLWLYPCKVMGLAVCSKFEMLLISAGYKSASRFVWKWYLEVVNEIKVPLCHALHKYVLGDNLWFKEFSVLKIQNKRRGNREMKDTEQVMTCKLDVLTDKPMLCPSDRASCLPHHWTCLKATRSPSKLFWIWEILW